MIIKGIRIIFLILLTYLFSFNSQATELRGAISGTLTKANSPYVVTADLFVVSGQSLTIEAGVVIKFNSNVSFFIDGQLIAEATPNDSISFTSNNARPNVGDWNGIFFRTGSAGSLKYVVVEYAATGIEITGVSPTISNSTFRHNNNGMDCLTSSSPVIQNNHFDQNINSAIRCISSTPTIKGNHFKGNSTDGFESVILCNNSSALIVQNLFQNNGNSAIDCTNNARPKIYNNTIVNNNFAITITDSSPLIKNNIIVNNTQGVVADNSQPVIAYNDVWSNSGGNFVGTPTGVGVINTTNANGDPSDAFFNITLNPDFVNPGSDFELKSTSPCIDAGDPANPGSVIITGSAPDMGAFEFNTTVPVELSSFQFVEGKLRWVTVSETNNFGFEIQRSTDKAGPFEVIGFVRGFGTTTEKHVYEFKDNVKAGIFYYRLKQIDLDGSWTLSEIIKAVYHLPERFLLEQNYPNPFNPETAIVFHIGGTSQVMVNLSIYNSRGQKVADLLNELVKPGSFKLRWNGVDNGGRPVASGIYYYRLRVDDQVITRRMILSR